MTKISTGRARSLVTIIAVGLALAACSSGNAKHPVGGSAEGSSPTVSVAAATTQPSATTSHASAPAVSSSASVDVCGLLTAAQASSINHVTYGSPTAQQLTSGWDDCEYPNTGKHADPVDIQALHVDVLSIPGCWNQLESADGPGKPVHGIGDAAFGNQIGIDVKVGDRCLEIRGLTHAELENDYSRDVAMARIVLGHLH